MSVGIDAQHDARLGNCAYEYFDIQHLFNQPIFGYCALRAVPVSSALGLPMPTNHEITLLQHSKPVAAVLVQKDVEYEDGRPVCGLELCFNGNKFAGSGLDFFEALLGIRRQIESTGLLLQVYGSSRNVWPSGMARQMGLGRTAYKMTKGKQALKQDMVNIFATGPDVEPATVAEQEQFRNEWVASLGQPT